MNIPRKSQVLETKLTSDEIRQRIKSNADKFNFWESGKNSRTGFSYKFDGNLIYLHSYKLRFWRSTEIELRDFTEPKLKVHYVGFSVYAFIYFSTLLVVFFTGDFQFSTINEIFEFLMTLGVFIIPPATATYLQKNMINWLVEVLEL